MDPRLSLTEVVAHAQRVEALGYDGLHVAETIHDALAVALLAAEHTERITIRTSVALAFTRSPTLTAYAAWDLAKFSGGRFELGLGTQIRQNIEDRYAMPFSDDPIGQLRDYVGAVRAAFAAFAIGRAAAYESAHYRVTRLQPYFNPGPDDGTAPAADLPRAACNAGPARWPVRWPTGSSPTRPTPTRATSRRPASRPGRRRAPRRAGPVADGDFELVIGTPGHHGRDARRRGQPSGSASAGCWPSCTRRPPTGPRSSSTDGTTSGPQLRDLIRQRALGRPGARPLRRGARHTGATRAPSPNCPTSCSSASPALGQGIWWRSPPLTRGRR